jgi:hypothetical protein
MLAKCVNPSCFRPFLHLDQGRLFRLDAEPTLRSSEVTRTEYFWLCESCSSGMILRLAADGEVTTTGLQEALRDDPRAAFLSVNSKSGFFFRSVAFFGEERARANHRELTIRRCAMQFDYEERENIVAAATSCPMVDCGSLVIQYRTTDCVRPGHPEDWEFTCSRCGMEFTVARGELIFQSLPKQWFAAGTHVA